MIRYKGLGYLVLSVTDLEKSLDFYVNTVGMQFVERDNENVYLRSSYDHHNLILQEGPEPGLKRVGWELEKASQFQEVFDCTLLPCDCIRRNHRLMTSMT